MSEYSLILLVGKVIKIALTFSKKQREVCDGY